MSANHDYKIISKAVPADLATKVAEALSSQRKYSKEKYDAYVLAPVCEELKRVFETPENIAILSQMFKPNTVADHVFAGIFRETGNSTQQHKKTGASNEIYVTVALTALSPDNGWYVFFEGSRANCPIPDEKKTKEMMLDTGDAVIWRGDLVYLHPPGGGGMFQTIVYKLRE